MENQHIKTHSKDGIDVRPSKEHSRTVDKYNAAVTESLKRINELISKI
jgi:phosphotransferase system HPr-like phosphotransfer protein